MFCVAFLLGKTNFLRMLSLLRDVAMLFVRIASAQQCVLSRVYIWESTVVSSLHMFLRQSSARIPASFDLHYDELIWFV